MNQARSCWLPLVVDDGQPAQSSGQLVEFDGLPHLQCSGGSLLVPDDGSSPSASMLVPLRGDRSAGQFADLGGHQVVAYGRWFDEALNVEGLTTEKSTTVAPPSVQKAAFPFLAQTPGAKDTGYWHAPRDAVERELFEDGSLLDVSVTTDRSGLARRIALAVDVERVSLILKGEMPLEVVQSRWTAANLRRIEEEFCEEETLLRSFGRTVGHDKQMRVTATVLRLSTHLRRRLDKLPAEAIDLNCLVLPRIF